MENIFTNIYEKKIWGDDNNPKYGGSSGSGSEINYNKNTYVPFLKNFIINNNIKSVIDLGCGDFKCGPLLYNDLDISYSGYDCYNKVVEYNKTLYSLPKYNFLHLDFCNNKEEIINGDLCILKDVIMHWSLDNIYNFLDYLVENKKFKYIVISNCCNQTENNTTISDGEWRQLSCNFLPLKKYDAIKIYSYVANIDKEVSVIKDKLTPLII